MGKKLEGRLFYVQQLYSEAWVSIEEFYTFKDARRFIEAQRNLDKELDVFNFYRICVCSIHRMDFIDFN